MAFLSRVCVLAVCRSVGLSVCPSVGLSGGRFVGLLVCRSVGWSVCRPVGLSDCRSVGLTVCWFVGRLVRWLVGLLVCRSVGLSVCWSVGLLACRSVRLLVCWFVGLKRLSPFLGFVSSRLVLSCLVFALLWGPLGDHFWAVGGPFCSPKVVVWEFLGRLGLSWGVPGASWSARGGQKRQKSNFPAFRLEEAPLPDHLGTILEIRKQSFGRDDTSRILKGRKLENANTTALLLLRSSISCFLRLWDLQHLWSQIEVFR